MTRINLNIPAVQAQRQLAVTNKALQQSLQRLSSGLRINRGADDPAGLIVSTRLQSEIGAAQQAIKNSERAINVIATAEGSLSEIQNLLLDIRDKAIESANTGAFSDDEIRADQLQVDSAIESISRIANSTNFAGRKLIDGSLDFTTSAVNTDKLNVVNVFRAKFGHSDFVPVEVSVLQSAQQGELNFLSGAINTGNVTIELRGVKGSFDMMLFSGETASQIVIAVNNITEATGVTAALRNSAVATCGVVFRSEDYGTDAFVSITVLEDPSAGSATMNAGLFSDHVVNAAGQSTLNDYGQDVQALINGTVTLGSGLTAILNSTLLTMDLTLDPTFAQNVGSSTTFYLTGGGALFQLGPSVDPNLQEQIGIQSMTATRLGDPLNGYLSQLKTGGQYSLVNGEYAQASDIIDLALDQVSKLRGRLGALERNMLDTNIRQLQITFENLTASESIIRDTDFAAETTELTRAQILQSAGTSVLAIANTSNQNVLTLLSGR